MTKDKSSPLYGIADCYVSQAWNTLGTRALLDVFRDTSENDAVLVLAKEARRLQREAREERRRIMLKGQHAFENQGVLYITLCACGSCYGGHEEGGWYYTSYDPIMSVSCLATSSDRWIKYLERKLVRDNRHVMGECGVEVPYEGHGVGGCGDSYDLNLGESLGDYGFDFRHTWGCPYEWEGRPHYE